MTLGDIFVEILTDMKYKGRKPKQLVYRRTVVNLLELSFTCGRQRGPL